MRRRSQLFKKALAADPNYALAHARLAHAYAFHAVYIVPDEQEKWISLAKDEINRADAIDAQLPETHLARALVLYSNVVGLSGRPPRYEKFVRRSSSIRTLATTNSPSSITTSDLKICAEREFQKAFEIDPTSRILARDYVAYYAPSAPP